MKYFSMPSDFRKETVSRYAELNEMYEDSKIIETYGQISIGTSYEAGRVLNDIPKVDLAELKRYIEYSASKGIGFNYTINGTCMSNREFTVEGVRKFRNFLDDLHEAGVKSLTISMPSLMEIVKSSKHHFDIKASTLCTINNANKALAYKKLGVDRIVPEEAVNRDFDTLKSIVDAFGDKVEIIINTLCYRECIYRTFHYNQMGHDSVSKDTSSISTYYNHLCMLKRCENVSNVLKLSWVRPEDLKYYTDIGIRYFKVQGRHNVAKGDPLRVAKCYFDECYSGNLIELLELFNPPNSFSIHVDNKKLDGYLKAFYDNPGFCKRNCESCGYCDSFAKKCISYESAQEMNSLATKFYNEYDEFKNLLKAVSDQDEQQQSEEGLEERLAAKKKVDIDFDL